MLESRVPRTRSTPKEETEAETKEDMAYTPIGIPLIAGPGAISSVMIFSSETDHWEYKLVLLGVISLVMGLTYIIYPNGRQFNSTLRDHRTANYSANNGAYSDGYCSSIRY